MPSQILTVTWLPLLPNSKHDSYTAQIFTVASSFQTDNESYNTCVQNLLTCRDAEDGLWNRSRRDPASASLRIAYARMDAYVRAARSYISAHAGLPAFEPTVEEAMACLKIFTDINFKVGEGYHAGSDKVIQMRQNLLPHETFLTQIGAWPLYEKANTEALEVRRLLIERASTLGDFVKGELKTARRATDLAIAELYGIIEAMNKLQPSVELAALISQLFGLEDYAKKYDIKSASSSGSGSGSGSVSGSDTGTDTGSGSGSGSDTGTDTGTDSGSDTGSGTGTGTGDDPATGGSGTGSDPGTGTGTGGDTGGSGGSDDGGYDYSDDGME